AVCALFIFAGTVAVPIGGLHQLLEGPGVAFTEQIAGLLPAENIARGHAPGRALVVLVAREEVEEQALVQEIPAIAVAELEHIGEETLGLLAVQEVLLIRGALVGVTGRD